MVLIDVWEVYCNKWMSDSQKRIQLDDLLSDVKKEDLQLFDEIFIYNKSIDDWYNQTYRGKQLEFELVIAEPIKTVSTNKEENKMGWNDRWQNDPTQYEKKYLILENVSLHKIIEEAQKIDADANKEVFATQPFIKEGVTIKVRDETVEVGQKEKIRQGYDCILYYKERKETMQEQPKKEERPTEMISDSREDDLVLDDELIIDEEQIVL